ncbi:segregation and condensation protein A [Paenibacillus elgii]|uniref:Segregation and condensation protein A n=1 Tax=Paenibacillus elgii TaxID=189691 RepID=A0A163V125_9BACL|nr:segregation/condensation protein A [Paenibacillus elgii]KZE74173.1 segregation and condensation protein A [Paenibacillus elgii]MCM3269278.1 segregation/condensation protein A [Paenibacillus elgii]
MKVTVKLETFEGPLDLLLHLIDKAEVDIYDIPIKEITDQYMEYLDAMQELELEVTSEFLVMAATLLSIKSKMLLPKPPVVDFEFDDYMMDEEYDPRAELVAKLIEYRKYKAIADHLRDKEMERSLIYTREPEDLTPYVPAVQENPVKGLHVADLVNAFRKAMRRMQSRQAIAKIRKDEISVKDRMYEVVDTLEKCGGKVMFSKLLDDDATKDAIVVTFLALLELMKVKRIVCFQHKLFDDIVIQAREEGTADGFWADEISY